MASETIPVFDGSDGDTTITVEGGGWRAANVVRFTAREGASDFFVFHIDDPKAAKTLRKMLKTLAKRA